jgi:hypothetical protein|tara:strand:+ start:2593 stop:2796 length:204 start_codon:yes stop_codon:yes gene_type:complete
LSDILPVITDEMINALSVVFPSKPPELSDTDREVWFKAGQRSVVDYLVEQQRRQKETMLTNSVIADI